MVRNLLMPLKSGLYSMVDLFSFYIWKPGEAFLIDTSFFFVNSLINDMVKKVNDFWVLVITSDAMKIKINTVV